MSMTSNSSNTAPLLQDHIKAEELTSFEALQQLTDDFRSSLQLWRDSDGNTKQVVIDGKKEFLLYADAMKVRNYAQAYTKIWDSESAMLKTEMKNQWYIDCRNLYIDFNFFSSRYNLWAPARFDRSVLDVSYLFEREVFIGFVRFDGATFVGGAQFHGTEFRGPAIFDNCKFAGDAIFTNAKFLDSASFQRLEAAGTIDFSLASFHRAPLLHETKLPQGTSFDGASFAVDMTALSQVEIAQDARAFRTLKQAASSYKGQQDEADFFAHEQKARRIAFLAPHIVWKDQRWRAPKCGLKELLHKETVFEFKQWKISSQPIEWLISLGYDWISGYGRHPGRAIFCLIAINVLAAASYRYMFYFGGCAEHGIDYCTSGIPETSFAFQNPAIHLAIQNLLNPSALVSEKAIVTVRHPVMLFMSIVQFSSSYLVLFLAALAVRSRFQKGSGGDK